MKATHNLDAWNLTENELAGLANRATVRFDVAYPNYQLVLAYPPAERKNRIAALMRQQYQALKACLPKATSEKLGSHHRPTGIRLTLPLHLLPALLAEKAVTSIWVEDIEQMTRPLPVVENSFWSVKARFAIQIENETTGLQSFEDRILLIRALDEEDAQRRLLPTFADYATPYLNSSGRLVRWKFEKLLDAYQVGIWPLDSFLNGEYIEVLSEIKKRKLIPDVEWKVAPVAPIG